MKTVKEHVMSLSKKWRTYDQIGAEVKEKCRASYETIARNVRLLVNEDLLEGKLMKIKEDKNTTIFKLFRRK